MGTAMGSSDIEMSGQRSAQDFAGRVAIVTGAWRGLGRAAAERFHERGASVAVNVRDRERAESRRVDRRARAGRAGRHRRARAFRRRSCD